MSVIVPVFNALPFLDQCLQSLRRQTLSDLEIICVNDGSTDGSFEVLRRHQSEDCRITLIDQPNGGYGRAMNAGLQRVSAEWFGVVEADDYAEFDMYMTLLHTATSNQVDMVKSDFYLTWTQPEMRDQWFRTTPVRYQNRVVIPCRDFAVLQSQPAIWSNLYRTQLIRQHHLTFLETPGASYQDTSFNYMTWMVAQNAYVLPRPFIHYRQDNSASSTNDSGKVWAAYHEIERVLTFAAALPQQSERWIRVLQGIAYKTFRWNLLRIGEVWRHEFIGRMRRHFIAAQCQGLLEPAYFEEEFLAEVFLLVRRPDQFLAYLLAVSRPQPSWSKARVVSSSLGWPSLVRQTGRMIARRGRRLRGR